MTQRTIILHYHLFKNAGTSVDRVLQDSFPDRWVTREFSGQSNTSQVEEWIAQSPGAVAFSSHTMMGPLPRVAGVDIVSLIMLRDPIARIRSAYRFEHRQASDNFGAVLARHTDFEGYVRVRLAMPADRQCRNFQTWRLASLVPGPETELERATKALEGLSIVGRVDAFGDALGLLKVRLGGVFPEFHYDDVRMNVSGSHATPPEEADALGQLLQENNRSDLALLRQVRAVGF